MSTNIDKAYFFIKEYINKNKYSPSFREIGEYLGGLSTSTVSNYIDKLEESGKIRIERNKKSRTIVLNKTNYKRAKEHIEIEEILINDRNKLKRKLKKLTGVEYYQTEAIINYIDKLIDKL